MINIILADDHALFRKGLLQILENDAGLNVVYEAEDGEQLIAYLHNHSAPDIILMDLNMPVLNGVEATRQIHEVYPEISIIALTSYYSASFINNMLQCGASAFLNKNSEPFAVIHAISEVSKKGYYYSDDILRLIDENLKHGSKAVTSRFDNNHLTAREKEILLLICRQYTTAEIASTLSISPRTVDGHRNNLLLKTDAKNMIGLLVYALEKKMLDINDLLF